MDLDWQSPLSSTQVPILTAIPYKYVRNSGKISYTKNCLSINIVALNLFCQLLSFYCVVSLFVCLFFIIHIFVCSSLIIYLFNVRFDESLQEASFPKWLKYENSSWMFLKKCCMEILSLENIYFYIFCQQCKNSDNSALTNLFILSYVEYSPIFVRVV